jgi:hypothetical protein
MVRGKFSVSNETITWWYIQGTVGDSVPKGKVGFAIVSGSGREAAWVGFLAHHCLNRKVDNAPTNLVGWSH